MKKPTIILAAFAAILTGCVTNSSYVMVGQARNPIDPIYVKVYATQPDSCEEIALVEASSEDAWAFSDQAKMDVTIQRLKEQAAVLGANGIVMRGFSSRSGDAIIIDNDDDWDVAFSNSEEIKIANALAIWVPGQHDPIAQTTPMGS